MGELIASPAAFDPTVHSLLKQIFVESLRDTDAVVAVLEQMRRTNPTGYIAACLAFAKLLSDVPALTPQFNVISAIPRSKLDDLPPSMSN